MPESDFGVEVEECVEAALELSFNLLTGTLDHVHGDVGFMTIGQLESCIVDFSDLAFGQKPQTVDQSQIRHGTYSKGNRDLAREPGVRGVA